MIWIDFSENCSDSILINNSEAVILQTATILVSDLYLMSQMHDHFNQS